MIFDSKWITYKTGENNSPDDKYGNPSPYFRRGFSVASDVKRATLYVSALGVFKAFLNGAPVSNDYLSPGWVDYHKRLPYVTYDITDMLRKRNAVGVVLGDGWAVGHLGSTYAFKRCGYSERVEFTALLRIEYSDGHTDEISTDSTWRASSGAIRRSDIYMGEYVDGRLALGDFSSADYDDGAWEYAEECVFKFSRNLFLDPVKIPPIVVKHRLTPHPVSKNGNKTLYNVGQNIAGVVSLSVRGERGAKITVRHGELLSDGALYTENLRKAEATDTYILAGGGVEKFRPLFTYHGFQYFEIEIDGNAEILDAAAEAMYTDLSVAGEFSCSDEIVNKIYSNALWGQRDNFLGLPTDCPQRDERLGWTADAQIFARSAMWNMDCRAFYDKYLSDIRDAQLGNGVIPAVAPVPPVGSRFYTGRDCAAGWAEAIAELPYDHFIMYGDTKILRDNLPAAKRLLDYYAEESPNGIRNGGGAYGDWLSLGTPSDLSAISTLYYTRLSGMVAFMCRVIGDTEAERYEALFERQKRVFSDNFVSEDGKILSDTQSLYAIAYKSGIITREEAKRHLERKLNESCGKLTTGFLGIKFLLPTLCDIGRADLAYGILTSTEFPGWGYSIMNGATTVWEHWDSFTAENGIRAGMNSFNHYSFGSCVEWMFEYCLGIRPTASGGFKSVILAPTFDPTGKITSAKGRYATPCGEIEVLWEKTGDKITYTATVPNAVNVNLDLHNYEVVDSEHDGNKYTVTVLAP
ncbi:MAG: family 78 glycoside hydrolase catalytic domain [Clostridia bacterium]|nr:family 78 glycoside hydrolase catalytic domain [Clostridia bacterium]